MADTKLDTGILEKRIRQRAVARVVEEITKLWKEMGKLPHNEFLVIKLGENNYRKVSSMIESYFGSKNESWCKETIDKHFWFDEKIKALIQKYEQEETDKFLSQIDIVQNLLKEQQDIEEPDYSNASPSQSSSSPDDVPF